MSSNADQISHGSRSRGRGRGKGRGGDRDRDKGAPHSGRGGSSASSRDVTISKAMSNILRHNAQREGLRLDESGYANVADLLAWHRLKKQHVSFDEIKHVVRTNEKQRFAMIRDPSLAGSARASKGVVEGAEEEEEGAEAEDYTDPDPSHYLIRATQGHSIPIAASNLLTPLTLSTAPPVAVHGTYWAAWPRILASGGLKRMGRTHIHLVDAALLEEGTGLEPPSSFDGGAAEAGAAAAAAAALAAPTTAAASAADSSDPPPPDWSSQPSSKDPAVPAAASTILLPSSSSQPQPRLPQKKLLSGARSSCEIYIYVDVHRSMRQPPPPQQQHQRQSGGGGGGASAPIQWWTSANGVLLTEGDPVSGVLSTEFFLKVVARRDERVLWEGGRLVEVV